MRTRSVLLLCLGSLLFNSWTAMLHADPLEQIPQIPTSSVFLLVASQQITEPIFHKTVLLVTKHGNTGPIGFILNRPQSITLDKIFPAYPAASKFSLFNGGPVYTEQISCLVRGGDAAEGSVTIFKDIYLAFDTSHLAELLGGKQRYTDLRVMHGVAAWARGQLENEIKRGDWFVMPFEDVVIFDRPPDEMWQELHRRANHALEF